MTVKRLVPIAHSLQRPEILTVVHRLFRVDGSSLDGNWSRLIAFAHTISMAVGASRKAKTTLENSVRREPNPVCSRRNFNDAPSALARPLVSRPIEANGRGLYQWLQSAA